MPFIGDVDLYIGYNYNIDNNNNNIYRYNNECIVGSDCIQDREDEPNARRERKETEFCCHTREEEKEKRNTQEATLSMKNSAPLSFFTRVPLCFFFSFCFCFSAFHERKVSCWYHALLFTLIEGEFPRGIRVLEDRVFHIVWPDIQLHLSQKKKRNLFSFIQRLSRKIFTFNNV